MFSRSSSPRLLAGLSLAAALAAVSAPLAAHADTLYAQPYAETANGGYFASTQAGYLQFDSFVLAADARIESVGWYGVDLNEILGWTPVNPVSFSIGIYADDGNGQPGSELATTTIPDSGGATDTGLDLQGLTLYQYSGTLPTPFLASAGTRYWIAIVDPTDNADWFWASGAGPDGTHAALIGGQPGVYADDLSFVLQGSVVPEPGSAALFLLGAAGLLGRALRRRATPA